MAYNVGVATIRVRPDLDGFRRALKRAIDSEMGHAEVEVDLDKSQFEAEKKKLEAEKPKIDVHLSPDMRTFDRQLEVQLRARRPRLTVDVEANYVNAHGQSSVPEHQRATVDVDMRYADATRAMARLTRPRDTYVRVHLAGYDDAFMRLENLAARRHLRLDVDVDANKLDAHGREVAKGGRRSIKYNLRLLNFPQVERQLDSLEKDRVVRVRAQPYLEHFEFPDIVEGHIKLNPNWRLLRAEALALTKADPIKLVGQVISSRNRDGHSEVDLDFRPNFSKLRRQIHEWNLKGNRPTVWVDIKAVSAQARAEIERLTRRERKYIDVEMEGTALDRAADSIFKSLGGAGNAVASLQAVGAAVATVGLSAAGALPEIAAFGKAVGVASQSALVLPAGLTAAAAAGAAAFGVFYGFSEILSESSEVIQEFPEGLREITDGESNVSASTRDAADSIQRFSGAVKAMQGTIRDSFFTGFSEPFEHLARKVLPVAQDNLDGVAASFGDMVKNYMFWRGSDRGVEDFNRQLSNTNRLFSPLTQAVQDFGMAWNDIATVSSEFLPSFGQWLGRGARGFSEWASQARHSGELMERMQFGFKAFGQVGRLLGDSVGVMSNVLSIASHDAERLMQKMSDSVRVTREWTESLEGRNAISAFFEHASRTSEQFMGILKSLGKVFTTNLTPVLAEFMTGFGPKFSLLIEAIGPALDALAPSMRAVGAALGDFLMGTQAIGVALAPAFEVLIPGLVAGFRVLAPIIGGLTAPIYALVAAMVALKKVEPMMSAIAAFTTRPFGPAMLGISGLAGAVMGLYLAFEPFRDVVDAVVEALRSFNDALGGVPGRIAAIGGAVALGAKYMRQLVASYKATSVASLFNDEGKLRSNLTAMQSVKATMLGMNGTLRDADRLAKATGGSVMAIGRGTKAARAEVNLLANAYGKSAVPLKSMVSYTGSVSAKAAAAATSFKSLSGAGSLIGTSASKVQGLSRDVVLLERNVISARRQSSGWFEDMVRGAGRVTFVGATRATGSYRAEISRLNGALEGQRAKIAALAAQYERTASRAIYANRQMQSGFLKNVQQMTVGTGSAFKAASLHVSSFAMGAGKAFTPMVAAGTKSFGVIKSAARSLGSAAMGMVGGPWGAAFTVATAGAVGFVDALKRANAQAEALRGWSSFTSSGGGSADAFRSVARGVGVDQAESNFVSAARERLKPIAENDTNWLEDAGYQILKANDWDGTFNHSSWAKDYTKRNQSAADARNTNKVLEDRGYSDSDVAEAARGGKSAWEDFKATMSSSENWGSGVEANLDKIRDSVQGVEDAIRRVGPAGMEASSALAEIGKGGESAVSGVVRLNHALIDLATGGLASAESGVQLRRTLDEVARSAEDVAGATLNAQGNLDTLGNSASANLHEKLMQLSDSAHKAAASGEDVNKIAGETAKTLETLAAASGLAGDEWESTVNKYRLTPEQIKISADLPDADEVARGIATVMEMAKSSGNTRVEVPVEMLTDDAKEQLKNFIGADNVTDSADKKTVKVNLDDEEARANLESFLNFLGDEKAVEIMADLNTSGMSLKMDEAFSYLSELDGNRVISFADVDVSSIPPQVADALFELGIIDSADPRAVADLDWSKLSVEQQAALAAVFALDDETPTPRAGLNKDNFNAGRDAVKRDSDALEQIFKKVQIGANTLPFQAAIKTLPSMLPPFLSVPVKMIASVIGRATGGTVEGRATGGTVPGFASGTGRVFSRHEGYQLPNAGPGTGVTDGFLAVDSWGMPLARLDANEWIINGASSAKYGKELAMINAGTFPKLPGFASGGVLLDAFARDIEGKPYVWGGVNWGDCSGAQSALARFSVGLEPFAGRFATMSEGAELAKMGFINGIGGAGSLLIGWYNGGPWGGHTVGRLPSGVNVEMGGGRGNGQYGGPADSPMNARYTDHAYLPAEWFSKIDAPIMDELNKSLAMKLGQESFSKNDAASLQSAAVANAGIDEKKETVTLKDLDQPEYAKSTSISSYAGSKASDFVIGWSADRLGERDSIESVPEIAELANSRDVEAINRDVQGIQFGDLKVNKLTLRTPEMHQLLAGRGKGYDPNFWDTDPSKVDRDGDRAESKSKQDKAAKELESKPLWSKVAGEAVGAFVESQVADLLSVFNISDNPPWFNAVMDFKNAWDKRVYTAKDRRYKIIQVQEAAARLRKQYPDVALESIDPRDMPGMRPDESLLTNYGGGDANLVEGRQKYESVLGGRAHKDVVAELRKVPYDPNGGAKQWRKLVQAAMYENGFDPSDDAGIDAVIREIDSVSKGDPRRGPKDARVQKGADSAVGLLNVTDSQLKMYGEGLSQDRFDPWTNISVALRNYRKRYGSSLTSDWGDQEDKERERDARKRAQKRAYGGWITGFGGKRQDNIPVAASAGEFMVNAFSAEKAGPLLSAMNADPNLAASMQAAYAGARVLDATVMGSRNTVNNAGPTYEYHIHASSVDEGMRRADMHSRQVAASINVGR